MDVVMPTITTLLSVMRFTHYQLMILGLLTEYFKAFRRHAKFEGGVYALSLTDSDLAACPFDVAHFQQAIDILLHHRKLSADLPEEDYLQLLFLSDYLQSSVLFVRLCKRVPKEGLA